MPEAGYIYVLINPSMDGLVKIGKTTRDPSGRAKELSGATGVPSPFLLAYETLIGDCSAAEEFVYTLPYINTAMASTRTAPPQSRFSSKVYVWVTIAGGRRWLSC